LAASPTGIDKSTNREISEAAIVTDNSSVLLTSPRASLGLFRAARAMALVLDRDYVIPDDIKMLAAPVTAHRIILSPSARMRGVRSTDLVSDLLNTLTVPGATR